MKVVLFYPDPNNAVFYHRLKLPFEHIKGVEVKTSLGRIANYDLLWADVLIMSRVIDTPPAETKEILKSMHTKLIVDFDDYYHVPANHIVSQFYHNTKMAEKQIGYAEIADEVWVTNKRLQKVFLQHNNNVQIVPNAIPFGKDQFTPGLIESPKIRFFYAGGRTHEHDIELLANTMVALRKNEQFKEMGQMVLAGYDETTKEEMCYWQKMEDIWSGKRPKHAHFKRLEKLPVYKYMNLYNNADVGLIPLQDNLFNSMKSNLKILECATKMIPAICSRVSTFTDNEPPVKWVEKESDWQKHIMYYLNNPLKIIEDGKALYEWAVKYHNMNDINLLRYDLLNKLVNKKEVV